MSLKKSRMVQQYVVFKKGCRDLRKIFLNLSSGDESPSRRGVHSMDLVIQKDSFGGK